MSEIVETEVVMGGQPRIEGRHISVAQVAEWILDQGMSPEEVGAAFDFSLADIFRALVYYYDTVDEMQARKRERRQRVADDVATQPSPEPAHDRPCGWSVTRIVATLTSQFSSRNTTR